jgi:hypothetical protein
VGFGVERAFPAIPVLLMQQFAKRFTPASHLFVFGIADIALGECCFPSSGVYFVGYGPSFVYVR